MGKPIMIVSAKEIKYHHETDTQRENNHAVMLEQAMEEREALIGHLTLLVGSCEALEQRVIELEHDKHCLEDERRMLLEERTWTSDSVVKGLLQEWDARERGFKAAMEQRVGEWCGKERAMQREISSLQSRIQVLEKAHSKSQCDSDCVTGSREGKAARLKASLTELGHTDIRAPISTRSHMALGDRHSHMTSCSSDTAHCQSKIISFPKIKKESSLPKSMQLLGKRGTILKSGPSSFTSNKLNDSFPSSKKSKAISACHRKEMKNSLFESPSGRGLSNSHQSFGDKSSSSTTLHKRALVGVGSKEGSSPKGKSEEGRTGRRDSFRLFVDDDMERRQLDTFAENLPRLLRDLNLISRS